MPVGIQPSLTWGMLLATAFIKMRYASCSQQDIDFLRTRIVGESKNRPKLYDQKFRNVSIITAWNSQRDNINEMGCFQCAKDTNQKLTDYYFIDKYTDSKREKKKNKPKKKENRGSFVHPKIQEIL